MPAEYDEWETLMWGFQKALPHAAPGRNGCRWRRYSILAEQKNSTPS